MPQPSRVRPALVAALATLGAVGVTLGVVYNLIGLPALGRPFGAYYRLDLDVYRIGGAVFAHGDPIYGQLPLTAIGNPLPFTYPPLAAISFAPMSWMSLSVASTIMTIVSILALAASILLTLRSLGVTDRALWLSGGAATLAVAFVAEPVISTLNYGQVNLLLMALVLADLLPRKTPWPRGMLIGFVAAFKLTPAIFVLYLLLRRDVRAVLVTGISFVAFTLLGFVLAFGDSAKYWTRVLPDSNRIGQPAYPPNQSITGVLARLGVDDLRTPLWLLCSLVVLGIAVVAMHRALRADQTTLAVCVNALAGLLISPVSWSHHWVWAVPILLTLGVLAWQRRSIALGVWVALGAVLFRVAPHWILAPDRSSGLGWPLPDQLLASSYVWWGVATIVILALLRQPVPARPEPVLVKA